MRDPDLWRDTWLSQLTEFLGDADSMLERWQFQADGPDVMARTRARLHKVIAGSRQQRDRVQQLFQDLFQVVLDDRKQDATQLLPTRPEAVDNSVLAFSENVFRDWAWGDAENQATRAVVERLIDEPPGRLVVLGAGAGRLAVDLHQSLGPRSTWALDTNPLPLLVAERLIRGETVTLPEFPVAPHCQDDVVITRHLSCPAVPREGFAFVFADAFHPPFAPGSLDAVVTSWFIDATGRDVRETAATVNHVLRPGGLWINLGPLRFKQDLALCYTIEEIWDIVTGAAFDLIQRGRDDLPYFDSPVSGSRRIETVFSFAARKVGEAAEHIERDPTPAWIRDVDLPIPQTPHLMAIGRKSMFAGSVVGLIDGTRSMSQLADEMGRLWGFDAQRMLGQLRAFFATLPQG